jgi:hypothetical protein
MAALSAAELIGFELVLTHWSYLYLPWFFPFVAMALVGQLPGTAERAAVPMVEAEPQNAPPVAV